MATTPALQSLDKRLTPWNSLDRLKASLVFIILADLLFLAALFVGESKHHSLLQTIGKDAAPSIIAAQHIKVAIADMDAEAVDELLAKPGEAKAATDEYNARREEAAGELITAAQNITYGDAERTPIKTLQIGLGEYETAIQRARDFHERNDPQAISIYRQASKILDGKLLSAADALDKANGDVLEETFDSDRTSATETRIAIVWAGIVLVALLAKTQWDLVRKVHRLINPGLLAAFILALGLTFYSAAHLSRAAEDLRIAKQDAFTSIHALWQARALAYTERAQESRYLFQADSALDEASFRENAKNVDKFLASEMSNITFSGERDAATETVDTWRTYLAIDSQIKQLKNNGNNLAAIQLYLGKKSGQSNFQFARFDDALMRTEKINHDAFDNSVASGFAQLDKFKLIASVCAAAIAVFSAIGLLVRIREYL
jgi:hypothetical protein